MKIEISGKTEPIMKGEQRLAYSYYPGCSLESTACEYNDSTRQVFAALGAGLFELEDWNCCGATSAHSLNPSLALLLPARNLAIAQKAGRDMILPCAACFNRHKTVDADLRTQPGRRDYLESKLDFTFTGTVAVRPLLEVICQDIGLEEVIGRAKRSLNGLRVVGYYGCLLLRPPAITRFDDPEHPVLMDRLLEAIGAEARLWSYATDCCGGGLSLTRPDMAARLVNRLVERAREAGAQAMVTSCPLCQINLEMRQSRTGEKLPIFYFTELVGLALGLEGVSAWWDKHLIDPTTLLMSYRIL